MLKAMGPILSTGVVLVTAAVVVANPVAPPVRDISISTTQLSTSPEALIPFDKALLNSIEPQFPASNFSAALAQILGALAAAADRIGSEVNSAGSISPGAPATAPEPYQSAPPVALVPVPPSATPTATVAPVTSTASTAGVSQVFSTLVQDTGYLGTKVVETAYNLVSAIVRTPQILIRSVVSLMTGDVGGAFKTLGDLVLTALSPGLVLIGAVGVVIDNFFGILPPQPDRTVAGSLITAQRTTAAAPVARTATDSAESAMPSPDSSAAVAPRARHGGANRASAVEQTGPDTAAAPAHLSAIDPATQGDARDVPGPTPNHAGVAIGGRPAATDSNRGVDAANPRPLGANRAKAASPRHQSDRSAGPSSDE